jgi:hypothetical protein
MCICNRQLDPKTRRMMVIGNSSLAISLLLKQFVQPSGQIEQNCIHALCGFLLGFSIVASFSALIRRRAKQI